MRIRNANIFTLGSVLLAIVTVGAPHSEALASGLVFVIVNPIPGQEERNSDHLLEEGVAVRCNNLPVLPYKIDRLLDDPQKFEAMQRNVTGIARPRAAFDIVAKLLESGSSANNANNRK